MGHRIDIWIQRLLVPIAAILAMLLWHFGLGIRRLSGIIVVVVGLALFLTVVLDPGPKAKEAFSRFRNRTN